MFSKTLALTAVVASLCGVASASGALNLKDQPGNIYCIDVQNNNQADGTPVQVYQCNSSPAQQWQVPGENTQGFVRLAGTGFCLDAGENPGNNSKVMVHTCQNTVLPQQWWTYDPNMQRLKLANSDLCVDVQDGNFGDGSQLQVYQCQGGSWENQQVIYNNDSA